MEYTYDVAGNRLTKKEENLLVEQYNTYDLDQYSSINGNIMKYDKIGNLVEDKEWEYRYNFSQAHWKQHHRRSSVLLRYSW